MNGFLTLKLVMVYRTMIMYLNPVMYTAPINMGKMIPYLFNPFLKMSPPQAIPRGFQKKQLSLHLLEPQRFLLAPRKIIAMFANNRNLK